MIYVAVYNKLSYQTVVNMVYEDAMAEARGEVQGSPDYSAAGGDVSISHSNFCVHNVTP